MDTGHEPFVERNEKPDWDLIGIGAFDVLQQTLATIVLSRIDPQQSNFSVERLHKLFSIAQFHIEYLLKSQEKMVEKIQRLEEENARLNEEKRKLQKQMNNRPQENKLFECDSCSKLFVSMDFLAEHIHRRHRKQGPHNPIDTAQRYSDGRSSSDTSIWE